MSIALANSGPLQIELIEQRNDAPSMYRDFLAAGRVGAGGPFVYFETESHPGTLIELSEISGAKGRFFQHIAETARNWDGSEPVRSL